MENYNLLTEPWIHVKDMNGNHTACGLLELMLRAHEFNDIETPAFNGIQFPLFDYLIIRLITTLIADIYSISTEKNIGELLSKKQFDPKDIKKYFDLYGDRFDLFDADHPFMQSTDKDLEKWLKTGIKKLEAKEAGHLNICPTAVAESGRLFGTGLDTTDLVDTDQPKKKRENNIQAALNVKYALTYEQFAYLLLYANGILPGVGEGNKSGLCGNCYYWETLKGHNLFETFLLNSVMCKNKKPGEENKPVWRYDGVIEQIDDMRNCVENNVPMNKRILAGMFYPIKILRGYPEDGIVKTCINQSYKQAGEKYYDIIDELRMHWTLTMEPHGVHLSEEQQAKCKNRNNPYVKLSPEDALWIHLAGSLQVDIEKYRLEDIGKLTMIKDGIADKDCDPALNTAEAAPFIKEDTEVVLYYRICDEHWTYQDTGKIVGLLPMAIRDSIERQQCVTKIVHFFNLACNILPRPVKDSKSKKQNKDKQKVKVYTNTAAIFSEHMESRFGLHDGSGYIHQICHANVKDLDALCMQIKAEIVNVARNTMFHTLGGTNIADKTKMINMICLKLLIYGGLIKDESKQSKDKK